MQLVCAPAANLPPPIVQIASLIARRQLSTYVTIMKNYISCIIVELHEILRYNGHILFMEVSEMPDTINVTIRLDREVKERAERMFNDFGMNLSTAFNIFARQSLRQGKIPFEIYDPFYNEKNQAELSRRIADVESGKATFVVKTMEELEAMADE
jgi:DNA-damage-inducible protein J